MTPSALRTLLIERVTIAGGVNAFARRAGVSNCLVSRTMRGEIEPGPAVANALGYVAQTVFIKLEQAHD